MARRALGQMTLKMMQAVSAVDADPAERLLIACSGGADSLALAAAARLAANHTGLGTSAIVIDHGLQPDSAAVTERVVGQLTTIGYADIHRVAVEVLDRGTGPEDAARQARYAALAEVAEAIDAVVLLGHTLDDQAETVLLGLARGSGTRSLAGMPAARGRFRRPLLGVRRAHTMACCAELGLVPWQDPHNVDPAFTRVRVRTDVLPVLEQQLGPGVADALARTARQAGADADALDDLARQALNTARQPDGSLEIAELPNPATRHRAIRHRVLLGWLREAGARDVGHGHVLAVDRLITDWRGQTGIDVPGLRVVRRDGQLRAGELRGVSDGSMT